MHVFAGGDGIVGAVERRGEAERQTHPSIQRSVNM